MPNQGKHPIKIVAQKTGLSPHVIRMWEKRYRATRPVRTTTNRRLYSDAEVARLILLKRATQTGRGIGNVASFTDEELQQLWQADRLPAAAVPRHMAVAPRPVAVSAESFLATCLRATEQLDHAALETALSGALVSLSQPRLIDEVIIPLMQRIGEMWRNGALRVAHEHMASAIVRSVLGRLHALPKQSPAAPVLVVATPAGQLHEFGALIVAATAAAEGWHTIYLGPNLPAEEIAGAVEQSRARAVALSLIYPANDPRLAQELQHLRSNLAPEVVLFVGGRASDSYREVLVAIGAAHHDNMPSLRSALETLSHATPVSVEAPQSASL